MQKEEIDNLTVLVSDAFGPNVTAAKPPGLIPMNSICVVELVQYK